MSSAPSQEWYVCYDITFSTEAFPCALPPIAPILNFIPAYEYIQLMQSKGRHLSTTTAATSSHPLPAPPKIEDRLRNMPRYAYSIAREGAQERAARSVEVQRVGAGYSGEKMGRNQRIRQIYNPQALSRNRGRMGGRVSKNGEGAQFGVKKQQQVQILQKQAGIGQPIPNNKSISTLRAINKAKATKMTPNPQQASNPNYNHLLLHANNQGKVQPKRKLKPIVSDRYSKMPSTYFNIIDNSHSRTHARSQKIKPSNSSANTNVNTSLNKIVRDRSILQKGSHTNIEQINNLNEGKCQNLCREEECHGSLPFPKFNSLFQNQLSGELCSNQPQNQDTSIVYRNFFSQSPQVMTPIVNQTDSNNGSHNNSRKLLQLEIFQQLDKSKLKIVKDTLEVYYGEVNQQGARHGRGAIFYRNGKLYEGQFVDGDKEGVGCETYPDGSHYRGQFAQNKRNGKGRFQWSNGQVYDGQWKENLKHGSGLWQDAAHTASYLGQWSYGAIAGFGVLVNEKGERYEGEFYNFNKQGQGVYRFENGDRLVGTFRKNQPNGQCEYFWSNGDYYKGQFINGLRHGTGVIRYADGSLFQGQFRNDKKCGLGKQVYHDGVQYLGNYENDLRHGFGKLSYEQSVYYEGYWINNVAVVFQEEHQSPGLIVEDEQERNVSALSSAAGGNRLNKEKLSRLANPERQKILKSMKSKPQQYTSPKVQKNSNKDVLWRLCQPKRTCKCCLAKK